MWIEKVFALSLYCFQLSQEHQKGNDTDTSRYALRVVDHGNVTSLPIKTFRRDSKLFCAAACLANDGCSVFRVSGSCYLYTEVQEGDVFSGRQLKYYVKVMTKVPSAHQQQGMLVAIRRITQKKHILKLDLSTGLAKNYTLEQKMDKPTKMTCSSSEKKIYLIQSSYSKISVWILGHNRTEILTKGKHFFVFDIAADCRRNLLFASMGRSIGVLNETTKYPKFQRLTGLPKSFENIALDIEREIIFASSNDLIISVPYNGGKPLFLYRGNWIRGLAYDLQTGSIYFGIRYTVMKMSIKGTDKKMIVEMDQEIWKIRVHRDVVYIAMKVEGTLSAVNPRNGTILWSKNLFSEQGNIIFCIMD